MRVKGTRNGGQQEEYGREKIPNPYMNDIKTEKGELEKPITSGINLITKVVKSSSFGGHWNCQAKVVNEIVRVFRSIHLLSFR